MYKKIIITFMFFIVSFSIMADTYSVKLTNGNEIKATNISMSEGKYTITTKSGKIVIAVDKVKSIEEKKESIVILDVTPIPAPIPTPILTPILTSTPTPTLTPIPIENKEKQSDDSFGWTVKKFIDEFIIDDSDNKINHYSLEERPDKYPKVREFKHFHYCGLERHSNYRFHIYLTEPDGEDIESIHFFYNLTPCIKSGVEIMLGIARIGKVLLGETPNDLSKVYMTSEGMIKSDIDIISKGYSFKAKWGILGQEIGWLTIEKIGIEKPESTLKPTTKVTLTPKPKTEELKTAKKDSLFKQFGYMKANNVRIFTYSFKEGTSEEKVKEHAYSRPNTEGKMTAAYYYTEGSIIPADGITFSNGVAEANLILYETKGLSKWKYAYMCSWSGKKTFVNCELEPENGLSHPGFETNPIILPNSKEHSIDYLEPGDEILISRGNFFLLPKINQKYLITEFEEKYETIKLPIKVSNGDIVKIIGMNNFDGAWYYVSIDFLGEVKYGYLSEIVFFGQKGYSEVMFGI